MPGAVIERPQMTRTMYTALKRHIVRDRQKKKQEQEQDEALERLRKEREQRKKKEEEDNLNLEQTKEQITQLTCRMELLKNEKHELFSQLKKVLHQEDETKKKAQIKEQNELQSLALQYPASIVPGHATMFMQGGMPNRTKYLSLHQPAMPSVAQQQQQAQPQAPPQGLKRPRSPSPPPATIYPAYSGQAAKFPPSSYHSAVKQESYPTLPKQSAYPAQSTHVTYANQSGHTYQQSQPTQTYPVGAASAKYGTGQSAFTSYPSHFAQHQKGLTDHPAYPQGYAPVQQVPQSGYSMATLHSGSNLPLQQQLEQANQKAGFSEEKYKLQQQQMAAAGLTPGQQAPVMTSQITMSQHQGTPSTGVVAPVGKGSIVTGYPVRSQPVSTAYQPTSSVQVRTSVSHNSGIFSSSQLPRHPYAPPRGGYY